MNTLPMERADEPVHTGVCATVIVCTYNRCSSLIDTLNALASQRVQKGMTWEIIVVDNNSHDSTRETVRNFAADNPLLQVRYAFEGNQGLSHARNRGVALANGTFLLFTDDDVLPRQDWLQTVVNAMDEFGCEGCGGYIEPIWETQPPSWLTERFYGYLALKIDLRGPRAIHLSEEPPFGANMAFTRKAFHRVGLFDVSLGRKGSELAGGEEVDVFRRLLEAGGSVMYIPQARVAHKVEASRLTKRYFRRWRFQGSRNMARRSSITGGRVVGGVPLYLYNQLGRAILKTLRYRAFRASDEAFRQEMIIWHFLGLIAGTRDRRSGRYGKQLGAEA